MLISLVFNRVPYLIYLLFYVIRIKNLFIFSLFYVSPHFPPPSPPRDSVNEPATSRQPPTPELEAPIYLNAPLDNALNSVPHAQLMRLGGLTKYGMWASFGLTTVSVAATKFYVDHRVKKKKNLI